MPQKVGQSFDAQIILAVYRWERLRLDPEYCRDVKRWIGLDAEGLGLEPSDLKEPGGRLKVIVSDGTVTVDPFNHALRTRYLADCKKWGLHLLFDPATNISLEAMDVFPIFADTPARQPVARYDKHWRRLMQKLFGPVAPLSRDSSPDFSSPPTWREASEMTKRLQYKHFRFQRIPPGPFQIQLPIWRVHLRVLRRGHEVLMLRREGHSIRRIAEMQNLTRAQVTHALQVALKCISIGPDALQVHWATCQSGCAQGRIEQCEWMQRFGPPELRDRRWLKDIQGSHDTGTLRGRRRALRRPDPLDDLPDPEGPAPPARGKRRSPHW